MIRQEMRDHLAALERAGYSQATIRERHRVLATLPQDTLDLDREQVRAWWASRFMVTGPDGEQRERSKRSLSGEGSHVREFWRWCRVEGLLSHNPADWLDRMRLPKTKARPVSEGDLWRLLRDAPLEMRRMIALAALAGLRSAEIAAVQWEDIDREAGVMRIRGGKGEKDRSVPLSSGLLSELGEPGEGPIIGRRITGKRVSEQVGRFMRAAGVDLTAHKLRARYATRFLAATGDAVATAEVLGHADLTNIMRYAVASSDTMRRGAEAAGRVG